MLSKGLLGRLYCAVYMLTLRYNLKVLIWRYCYILKSIYFIICAEAT